MAKGGADRYPMIVSNREWIYHDDGSKDLIINYTSGAKTTTHYPVPNPVEAAKNMERLQQVMWSIVLDVAQELAEKERAQQVQAD